MTKEEATWFFYNAPEKIKEMIMNMDDDDAIEFTRLLHQIAKESELYKVDPEYRKQIDAAEKSTEKYEDICASEAVEKLKNEIALDDAFAKADESFSNLKKTLIAEINGGADNLREIARGMIQIEKDNGLFDPETWKGFDEIDNFI